MTTNPLADLERLGDYLREQRQAARLSLRQLSDLAGVSNPYLSQLERGLKRPSAEILGQIAKGLEVSAESLYVRAGLLDEDVVSRTSLGDVRTAVAADPRLTARQKETLLDIYATFVGDTAGEATTVSPPAQESAVPAPPPAAPKARTTTATTRKAAAPRARKSAATKTTN